MAKDYQKVRPFADPGEEWTYPSAGAITNQTAVAMRAAVTGKRNYVCAVQLSNTHATVGTLVQILSAATVLWQFYVAPQIAATAGQNGVSITFPTPLAGATGEAINVACVTNGSSVYANAQGYTA